MILPGEEVDIPIEIRPVGVGSQQDLHAIPL
jgi:hypothetical protein